MSIRYLLGADDGTPFEALLERCATAPAWAPFDANPQHVVGKTTSYAFFGDFNWAFAEKWRLSFGGRWSQGSKDDYRFVGTKTSIARQIGNAVPIPLGAALGTHVASALG